MPGYQMMFRKGVDSLSWAWAVKRLSGARNYWLATVRGDGRPHVMPVWGIWFENAFYFSTGPRSRKARNIEKNMNCVVCPENAAPSRSLPPRGESDGCKPCSQLCGWDRREERSSGNIQDRETVGRWQYHFFARGDCGCCSPSRRAEPGRG